jgi:hypothetical protein
MVLNLNSMAVTKQYAQGKTMPMYYDQGRAGWNKYVIQNYIPLNYIIDPDGVVQYGAEAWNEATIRAYIEGYLPNAVHEGKAEPMLKILGATPSPATGPTTIRYNLRKSGNVSLRVYSSSGKLVTTLSDGTQSAGDNSAQWNLRDDAGNTVANGMYVYVLRSGSTCERGKVSVLR